MGAKYFHSRVEIMGAKYFHSRVEILGAKYFHSRVEIMGAKNFHFHKYISLLVWKLFIPFGTVCTVYEGATG